jgi:hypothetical protein
VANRTASNNAAEEEEEEEEEEYIQLTGKSTIPEPV